ncbi:MAG: TIGR04372 family glycosyltransferase [Microcoleus sp. PH2017_10_PVI_O_A]|uniref:TIGR04372 family glycosyltransferase n=1 Tax=unclassified Microcoleus TaxID=2642155 RepID=UPI001D8B4D54|nr:MULTISPECIES: TIGR04372 family glycosyltransferase [unclassified Microcoleus]TAE80546.1 MAG: TIGR04372 family glycosyltransferase [Oscillatoriales cyanobacterium]MCC3405808.1 TIGR04372 family glycosyltransferase [Microcoleus sp. PH2017_10_PVI_O_A]MCC3459886.1 TIGR04372 family glycosyltransferase [Microcoleus sp. PH2017_11_PCY_U_A]MCC3478314.1 TIGR04372 family glycosyltransferase [Microcoleus sp. PH2017_12_PCY_D_A]MCC3559253.1 TIGR04372 family glycosyltransferase [Microcoleus sp. PH2017_27_L
MTVSYFQKANKLKQAGLLAEAIACYRQAIALNPNFYLSHHNLGETLAKLDRWEEAVTACDRAIQLNPNSVWSYYNLGEALAKLCRWEDAIASYRRAIELSPDFYRFYTGLGAALCKQGDREAAAASYCQAAEILAKQQRWNEAESCYFQAIKLNPSVKDSYRNLAETLTKQQQLEVAIATTRKAINLAPEQAENYCQLGEILTQQNRRIEAIESYKKAIVLNFDRELSRTNLVNLLIEQAEIDGEKQKQNKPSVGEEALFNLGNLLIQQGKLAEAIEIYQKVLELKPHWTEACLKLVEAWMKMSWNFYDAGKLYESIDSAEGAIEIYNSQLAQHPLGNLGIRFITPEYFTNWPWLGAIGHLALNIDLYIKMGILGWRPECHTILLAPPEQVINPCLLDYWRPYLHIITDPPTIDRLLPLAKTMRCLEYTLYHIKLASGQMVDLGYAFATVQKQWQTEAKPPLLSLSPSDFERGWNCLQQLGVPKNAWFVCLHVREDGFRREGMTTHRSADVDTYSLAIESIVARGGWVIRMGDRTMKPLPPMKQVIDYARTDAKSDWMDVFLSAECRFFLGSASGLACVPLVFGVPSAITNTWPISGRPQSNLDLFIPKLARSSVENRYLTFEEALLPRFFFNLNSKLLYSWGIQVIDNTPEEIDELVLEMFDRLEGKVQYTENDEALLLQFNSLRSPYGPNPANSRIGRSFLQKYCHLGLRQRGS